MRNKIINYKNAKTIGKNTEEEKIEIINKKSKIIIKAKVKINK